jgi:hypothetical protein
VRVFIRKLNRWLLSNKRGREREREGGREGDFWSISTRGIKINNENNGGLALGIK